MIKADWNPDLYLKFDKERIRPSIDLVARINHSNPARIIDIGCGPGNSTQVLRNRWQEAEVIGADNSPAMIKKAMNDFPNQKWVLFDALTDTINEKFDLVFSNATIQWIPYHDQLIKRLDGLLNESGVLAVQLPLFFNMPLGKSISEIGKLAKFRIATEGVDQLFTIHTASYYYDELANYFRHIDIWTTDYYHVMESPVSILDMIRTTGLKPYLERLTDNEERDEFETLVLTRIKKDYPLQQNGNVLFPFKRLFFVATK